MIVSMPFTYDVVAVEQRCRLPGHLVMAAWHAVTVDEVSGQDAPVAVRWSSPAKGRWTEFHTRWHGGRHWIEPWTIKGERGDALRAEDADGKALMDVASQFLSHGGLHRKALSDLYEGRMLEPETADFRETLYVGRADGMAEAERVAAKFLFVDGTAYVAAREPRISCYSGNREFVEASVKPWPNLASLDLARDPYRHPVFRADREADMREFAAAHWPGREFRRSFRIEVELPFSLQFDDEGAALLAAARKALDLGEKEWGSRTRLYDLLAELPSAAAANWFSLRDAVARSRDGAPDPDVEAHMAALASELPEGAFRDALEHAVWRWSLRPMRDDDVVRSLRTGM